MTKKSTTKKTSTSNTKANNREAFIVNGFSFLKDINETARNWTSEKNETKRVKVEMDTRVHESDNRLKELKLDFDKNVKELEVELKKIEHDYQIQINQITQEGEQSLKKYEWEMQIEENNFKLKNRVIDQAEKLIDLYIQIIKQKAEKNEFDEVYHNNLEICQTSFYKLLYSLDNRRPKDSNIIEIAGEEE